ncbi:hypothetical protein FOCC_FOCC004700 [Frankliniella occidentalis]|nr:hypothetical protein FOCC_FOCC004700 [Frankliniella occidentalis]
MARRCGCFLRYLPHSVRVEGREGGYSEADPGQHEALCRRAPLLEVLPQHQRGGLPDHRGADPQQHAVTATASQSSR